MAKMARAGEEVQLDEAVVDVQGLINAGYVSGKKTENTESSGVDEDDTRDDEQDGTARTRNNRRTTR